jgi:hypothetical protein
MRNTCAIPSTIALSGLNKGDLAARSTRVFNKLLLSYFSYLAIRWLIGQTLISEMVFPETLVEVDPDR